MKRIYTTLILLLCCIVFSGKGLAQSFNGGILAGGIVSQVNGDGYAGYHKVGACVGAFINLPIDNDGFIQMELKYTPLGSRSSVKEEVDYGLNHYNLRLHYAEIPLMLQYRLSRFRVGEKRLDFIKLEAGISLDFLLGFRDETNYSQNMTAKWRFFSVTGNVGIHFALGNHLGFGIRSMNSLLPIRYKTSTSILFGHYYNIALQAVLTYQINALGR